MGDRPNEQTGLAGKAPAAAHEQRLRLEQQIRFVLELDKLKGIVRRSWLLGEERRENSAEHSWHLAMMAIILAEYANEPFDLPHALKLLLVHDVVEIDAGDTYCYDDQANGDKEEREHRAAERIFGLLPEEQAREAHDLWLEFEHRETPEARFANAVDRMQPLLLNFHTDGRSWLEHDIARHQVLERNGTIEDGSLELWRYTSALIDEAVERGWLKL